MQGLYLLALIILVSILCIASRLALGKVGPYKLPLSLLLLVKDQEENIEGIFRKILFCRATQWYPFEIVVVDEGSIDRTTAIVSRLAHHYPGIIFVNGKLYPLDESAENLGRKFCSGELVVVMDLSSREKAIEATEMLNSFLKARHAGIGL